MLLLILTWNLPIKGLSSTVQMSSLQVLTSKFLYMKPVAYKLCVLTNTVFFIMTYFNDLWILVPWFSYMCPMLKLNKQCDNIKKWVLESGDASNSLHKWYHWCYQEFEKCTLAPFALQSTLASEAIAPRFHLRSRVNPHLPQNLLMPCSASDAQSASSLISHSPYSRTVRNKCLLFIHYPVLYFFYHKNINGIRQRIMITAS